MIAPHRSPSRLSIADSYSHQQDLKLTHLDRGSLCLAARCCSQSFVRPVYPPLDAVI